MIHSFSFRNFCSFTDAVEVSFRVGNRTPEDGRFASGFGGQRLTKVLCVAGANGAGKTSLMKALAFAHWFSLDSFRSLEPGVPIPFRPFLFREKDNGDRESTEFTLDFEVGTALYRYHLEINRERVLREFLKRKTGRQFSTVFLREFDESAGRDALKTGGLSTDRSALEGILRPNASLLSVLHQVQNPEVRDAVDFLASYKTNVFELGRVPASPFQDLFEAAEFYHSHPDIKGKASDLLSRLDLGLTGVDIKKQKRNEAKEEEEPKELFFPYGDHVINGRKYTLPLLYESSGTQNLFALLSGLIPVLESGSAAFLDEFEVDLHPQMIPAIVQLFFDPITNPKNAQLVFSCHSMEVLRILDKTQILLVEKDERCRSEVWRLDEVNGVRRDDNILSKYLSGAYGAVPNITV